MNLIKQKRVIAIDITNSIILSLESFALFISDLQCQGYNGVLTMSMVRAFVQKII